MLGTPVTLVGHPGTSQALYKGVQGGVFPACLCGVVGDRPGHWVRSLLGTPVVLVGDPGSGFWARIARLGRSRDAGVAGAEPRIRDHYRYSSAAGTLALFNGANRALSGGPEVHDGRCADHHQDQKQYQDGRQQHHQERPARGRCVHLADPYGGQEESVQGEDPPDKR